MNKLTNEEIARVFAMYWGCRLDAGMITKVDSFWMNKVSYGETDTVLLLAPLNKINYDDAIVMIKIFGKYSDNIEYEIKYKTNTLSEDFAQLYYKYDKGVNVVANFDKEGFHTISSNRGETYFFAYQELIKMGYSVPIYFGLNHWANGKSPIELGIAIESL